MEERKSNNVVGLLFVLLGVYLAAKGLFGWNLHFLFRGWWTLFIIVPSIISISKNGWNKRNGTGLIIGVLLLFNSFFSVFSFARKIILPLLLLGVGVRLITDNKNGNNSGSDSHFTQSY